ncbi:MAG: hypothetical protein QUS08_09200 [Methanothrix sp.]|nr:hypothetical protein [Methanothrix sp.]
MSWLDAIFPRREGVAALDLSEVGAWLDEQSCGRFPGSRLQGIYARISDVQEELRSDIDRLRSAEPDASSPQRLIRAALAARAEVVKQLEALAVRMSPPEGIDLQSASEHRWGLFKGLERSVRTFGKAKRYAEALFPEEVGRIDSDLARTSRLLKELEDEVTGWRREMEAVQYSRELLERIGKCQEAIELLTESIGTSQGRLEELVRSSAELDEEMKRYSEGAEGRRAEELRGLRRRAEEEIASADRATEELVAPLRKALGRVVKLGSGRRLELEHADVLEQLLESPLEVADERIAGALLELRSHLAPLGLRDRKREKTLEQIDHLIRERSLERARARRERLSEEIKRIESDLSECSSEAARIRGLQERLRGEIRGLEADLEESRDELEAARERLGHDLSELEERLSALAGRPVRVGRGP